MVNNSNIKKLFKNRSSFISNPLISGSVILFIGSISANVFNFLFNIFMSRQLTLTEYGVLASLISIITLFALVAESFMPTMVKFSSQYLAKQEIKNLQYLYSWMIKL